MCCNLQKYVNDFYWNSVILPGVGLLPFITMLSMWALGPGPVKWTERQTDRQSMPMRCHKLWCYNGHRGVAHWKHHGGLVKEILTAMRVMVVSIGSRGSHIPAMTPRRLRRGVIAGMWDPRDPIETTMTRISKQSIFLLYTEQYVFYTLK